MNVPFSVPQLDKDVGFGADVSESSSPGQRRSGLQAVPCLLVDFRLAAVGQIAQYQGDQQPNANCNGPTNWHRNDGVNVQCDVGGEHGKDAQEDDQVMAHVIQSATPAAPVTSRAVP